MPGLPQAVLDGVRRKARIVLLAREPFFLRRRHDAAVLDETGGRVVVVGRDAEDARHDMSEQRVDERRDGSRLGENHQRTEKHEHDHDWQEPVPLLLTQQLHQLRENSYGAHLNLKTYAYSDRAHGNGRDTDTSLAKSNVDARGDPGR